MGWVKAAEFAAQLGVSPQAVRKAIAEGRLRENVRREGRSWLIDDRAAAAEWDRNTAPQLQRGKMAERRQAAEAVAAPATAPAVRGGIPSQAQAMAMRTAYQAKLLELDFKQRQGELVNAADMERVRFESGRRVRDAILRLGPLMIGDIARAAGGLTPEQRAEVLQVLKRHHTQALEALADGNG